MHCWLSIFIERISDNDSTHMLVSHSIAQRSQKTLFIKALRVLAVEHKRFVRFG